MQKRKLYIVILAIILISLSGLSAQCLAAGEAPAIEFEIYDGPDCSASNDIIVWKGETSVRGFPDPEIDFGDDDNVKQLGPGRVEVSVKAGESYALIVIATNTQGTASVSIVLEGECGDKAVEKDADGEEGPEGKTGGDNMAEPSEEEPEPDQESEPAEEEADEDTMTEGVAKERERTEVEEEPERTNRRNIMIPASESMSGSIAEIISS